MTTTKCNICNREIPIGCHKMPHAVEGKAKLISKDGEVRLFTYEVRATNYQFNCTNFDLCKKCFIDAIARSVESLIDLENTKPDEDPR